LGQKDFVWSSELGKCENCGELVFLSRLSENERNKLVCPHCEFELTGRSFGYTGIPGKDYGKTLWINSDGEWTGQRPTDGFIIAGIGVVVGKQHSFTTIRQGK
jgi:hypothetical protein